MRRCRRLYLNFPDVKLETSILMDAGLTRNVSTQLINTANKLRQRADDLIKIPATQELIMAGYDINQLFAWNQTHLCGKVVARWLAGYQDDFAILEKIIPVEKLNTLLINAAKSDGLKVVAMEIIKPDHKFVNFGDVNGPR